MGEQQVFTVVVWGYDPTIKKIKVKVPRVFSARADAITFVRLNKVPNQDTNWEIHTTIAELTDSFSFSRDIPPNFK